MSAVIDIRDYSFGIAGAVILDSVSLEVREGEYVSIIGPNGAGKTTLLRCLMRIYSGGKGTIEVLGRPLGDYSQKELAKLMSYVPQSDGRTLPFTVEEFLLMGRYPYLSPFTSFAANDRRAVGEALDLTETVNLARRRLDTLSGGERQTVAIAAAIVQGAGIMLLDEPTTFLDPKHASDIQSLITKINRERGITIVSVTHDINSAALHSDRICIIKNGKTVYLGGAGDIMNNETLEGVYGKSFSFTGHPDTGALIIVPEAKRT